MIYLRKKLLLLNEIKEFVRKNTGKMLRELGLDLDRRGSVKCDDVAFLEPLSRHRNIVNMESMSPALPNSVYVAPNATVFGNVFIANDSYVGFGAVINGLYNPVRVGSNTKIGDHTTLMAASYVPDEALLVSLNVGNNVNIEMNCSLFGPVVDDNVHIGFGSVIM